MDTNEMINRVQFALEDTARKVTEEITAKKTRDIGSYLGGETYTESTPKYSRDWIAGRLLGLSETISLITTGPQESDHPTLSDNEVER